MLEPRWRRRSAILLRLGCTEVVLRRTREGCGDLHPNTPPRRMAKPSAATDTAHVSDDGPCTAAHALNEGTRIRTRSGKRQVPPPIRPMYQMTDPVQPRMLKQQNMKTSAVKQANDDAKPSTAAASGRWGGVELGLVLVDVGPLRPAFLEGISQEARRWCCDRGVDLGGGRRC